MNRFRVALLHGADGLGEDQKWRLTGMLLGQGETLAFGGVALAVVHLVLIWRTGFWLFGALLPLGVLLMVMRLRLSEEYARQTAAVQPGGAEQGRAEAGGAETGRAEAGGADQGGGQKRPLAGSPEAWTERFMVGALLFAAIWGATGLICAVRADTSAVPMFFFMVQAAWVAAASARNAASPAVVRGQAVLSLVPGAVGALLSGDPVLRVTAPLMVLQFIGTESIAGFGARQLSALLSSERALALANARLRALSATDALTGIANRRAFDAKLEAEWACAAREDRAVALLMADVDHFKAFNDFYGHPAGDACLKQIATMLRDGLRERVDYAARVGGEEFAAILPGMELAGALEVAERLRRAVESAGIVHAASPLGRVTISVGAYAAVAGAGCAPGGLVDAADRALYGAKQAGRNAVRPEAA